MLSLFCENGLNGLKVREGNVPAEPPVMATFDLSALPSRTRYSTQ